MRFLKGVGPEKERILAGVGIRTVEDLLRWFPRRHEKRLPVVGVKDLKLEDKQCVRARITSRGVVRYGGMQVFKAVLQDEGRTLFAVFFRQPYLTQVFKPGRLAVLYGRAEKKGRHLQMIHPEYEIFDELPAGSPHHGRWVPVYPLTAELTQKSLRQAMFDAVNAYAPGLKDPLPPAVRKRLNLVPIARAISDIHFPEDPDSQRQAYRRLVFDEFFAMQMEIERQRKKRRAYRPELAHAGPEGLLDAFAQSLPYVLTDAQSKALQDIAGDLRGERTMDRLIQGDVGSGKTVVAAAAVFLTAKRGLQSAVMAPTEVLAQQLYYQMASLLGPHEIRVGYLSNAVAADAKQALCAELAGGKLDAVVGTHALLQENVRFKQLGLALVDEQHKFGVAQRELLRKKGGRPVHYLTMTATPIPRTLAMTVYGDRDVTILSQKPASRAKVRTFWFQECDRTHVYRWIEALIQEGSRVFVVCPQIEGVASGRSAKAVFARLSAHFPAHRVGLLHGEMKNEEKTKIMNEFRSGTVSLLVTTTVIEVGVDIPEARCMVIEGADTFGLAQLHQLRGRVGRGKEESYCVLFSETRSEEARRRLEMFAATDSGFEIAEKDLELRGSGQVHGHRQHGLLRFDIGDMIMDADILDLAREEARRAVGGR